MLFFNVFFQKLVSKTASNAMNFPTTSISTGSIINNNILDDINPYHKAVALTKKEYSYYDHLYTTFQSARNHIYRKYWKKVERRTKIDHSNAAHVSNKTNIGNCNRAYQDTCNICVYFMLQYDGYEIRICLTYIQYSHC